VKKMNKVGKYNNEKLKLDNFYNMYVLKLAGSLYFTIEFSQNTFFVFSLI
jgi:hypothetical protein